MKKVYTILLFFIVGKITYSQNPIANFSASPLTICAGESVSFTNLSQTNGGSAITTYVWDFGDGSSFNYSSNPTHVFTNPGPGPNGSYQITLTVTNATGQADGEVKAEYITVLPVPDVDFSISGIGCTVPLTLNFNNLTTGGSTYNWNFGNGQTSTDVTPTAQTYNSAGSFTTILTATAANGCVSADTQNIVISNFQTDIDGPTNVCVGQPVIFEDNSTAGANSWSWDFGGLGTSSEQNPTFVFNTPGTYTIQLSSQNTASGCSGNSTQNITVQPNPAPSFSASPLTGCAPLNVIFSNTSGGGATFTWDFGDLSSPNNSSTLPSPSHSYVNNGSYNVTLTMTTTLGCIGTVTQFNYVNVSDFVPSFTATPTSGCNPLTVEFQENTSTTDPITNWNWDFGNGQTFNGPNGQNPPAQIYNLLPGIYDVELTVTTQSGCTGTLSMDDYIKVGQIDSIKIEVDSITNCIKKDFQFQSFVFLPPILAPIDSTELIYFWDFTDGTSTDADPKYKFTSDTGFFDVQFILDYRGCKDTVEIDSMVFIKAPIAKFSPQQSLYCNQGPDHLVEFTDDATHGKESDSVLMVYQWEYTNLIPSDTLFNSELDDSDKGDTSHQYNGYGSYTIQQIIHNYTTECSDSITATVDISTLTPAFVMSEDSICQGDSVVLIDQSTTWAAHPLASWSFSMGDGSTLTNDTVSYIYYFANPFGPYAITLTATNSVGCSADSVLPIHVLSNPVSSLTPFPDPAIGCSPFPVDFTGSGFSFPPYNIGIDSLIYTFSDNNSTQTVSAGVVVNHNFVGNGFFTADLVVVDSMGCRSTPTTVPVVLIKPTSSFTVDSVMCNKDTVTAINTTDFTQFLTYQWLLDDVPYSLDTNAVVVINDGNLVYGDTSNIHTISLITTDAIGCKDTVTQPIILSIPWANPKYSFTAAAIGPNGEFLCPPLFGAYLDSSNSYGTITEWSWDFGNGNQSILENPNNTYVLPGTYDLSLSVTDSYGCISDTTYLQYVTIGGPSGNPSWSQQVGQCLQGATFVVDNAINVDSTYWDLGNNDFVSDSLSFYYNYQVPGTYTPGAYLYDALGCEVFYPLNNITIIDMGLNASISATPSTVQTNDIVTFTDASTSASSTIISWEWNFLTDTIFAVSNSSQTYSYAQIGTYIAVLTVSDALGCQNSDTAIINVIGPDVWLPNVITTNTDGVNELFTLPYDAFNEFTVVILNRWGNVMYSGQRNPADPTFLWDGADQATGKSCTDGVYFYRITGILKDGNNFDKHGFVTVIESK